MTNIIYLNSHPIQYFAPLYREMAAHPSIALTVLYCSRHGLDGEKDREFGVDVKWDLPVLEGYRAVFLQNKAISRAGIYSFWGLFNPAVVGFLRRAPKSVVIVHGWGYLTHLLTLVAARLTGHTVCLRGESPDIHERCRSGRSLFLRRWVFGRILFRLPHRFLYIGNQNRLFYKRYGVPDDRLAFAPYAVDNGRFAADHSRLAVRREACRAALGIPIRKKVLLFSGKYIGKKRPMDLLAAFDRCRLRSQAFLVMVGDGALRPEMEAYIEGAGLSSSVLLTGFVNQGVIAEYYACADVFVMCSGEGETWGLSTNEAMNFHLPLILSDMTGSAADLVEEGVNGYTFPTGDVAALSDRLDTLLGLSSAERSVMGLASARRVATYSYQSIIRALLAVLHVPSDMVSGRQDGQAATTLSAKH
ncbi:MAG: hypothetical protein RLY31_906 [Bacteroidota bacterium]|jgi:glycosyltransferase involved in cell wall biosynthesis